jgi:hypothetical protein
MITPFSSVVIHDLNVVNVALFPSEANPPLIVYADAELAPAVAFERFKPIVGWAAQIVQRRCPVKIEQLSPRHPLEEPEPRHVQIVEQPFRTTVAKTPYHSVKTILFLRIVQRELLM